MKKTRGIVPPTLRSPQKFFEVLPPYSGAISKSRLLVCCLRRAYDGPRRLSLGRWCVFSANGTVC
jgi:hypothetical protein